MRPASRFAIALALSFAAPLGHAENFDGRLLAEQACPAPISIRRPDNPGDVALVPGETYRVIARNKRDATHWQVRIQGIHPQDRWVAIDCGRLLGADESPPTAAAGETSAAPARVARPERPSSMAGQFVLAASWQPAFCERRGSKPECRSQTAERPDARRFSLHGLWPQPIGNQYCGVSSRERDRSRSGDWDRLPAPDLDPQTRSDLPERMPGVVSDLHRHQWTKHGSCYGTDADTYFDHAMALLDQLNASSVQALFEEGIGQRLRASEIRAAFDRAFGRGAGERVRLDCDDQGLITELRIGLKGPISDDSRLADLIQAAPTRTVGCRGGWVDRAGRGR